MKVKIGIYKITSPSNKIYIGQSINIERRFKEYYRLKSCKNQIRLYNSFNKYKIENHVFEIIEKCSKNELNNKERYWQEFYDVIGKNGLNCTLVNSDSKKFEFSLETIDKIRISNTGKKHSKETKEKIGLAKKGTKLSEKTKEKIRQSNIGRTVSDKNKKILSDIHIGKLNHMYGKRGSELSHSKKVICTKSKQIWNSITECANYLGISQSLLSRYLHGIRTNKTTIIFLNHE